MERLYVLSLVYSLMLAIVYGVGQLNLDFLKFFSNAFFPITAAAASVASFLTLKRYVSRNLKPPFSIAWIRFSSGIILWFLGAIGKAWFFLTTGIILNVVADLFFSFSKLQASITKGIQSNCFGYGGHVAILLGFYVHVREL